MRITLVHSYYSSGSSSGENLVVDGQVNLLTRAGFRVNLVVRDTDSMALAKLYKVQSAFRVAYGHDSEGTRLVKYASSEEALVLNNLFPNFGTRWIQDWPGPVIVILHNFRYVCANGLLLREGKLCTACIDTSSLAAVRYGCYRQSRLMSLPLAIANRESGTSAALLRRADAVVAQSEAALEVMRQAHVERLIYVPGFGPGASAYTKEEARAGWVFVGRLSQEKGLEELLDIWPASESLTVIGDGPQRSELEDLERVNVRFLGSRSRDEVMDHLRRATGLIFPGICLEGAHPMVVREAMTVGTPVIAAMGGSAGEVVRAQGGGVEYNHRSKASLLEAMKIVANSGSMGKQARVAAGALFSPEEWIDNMKNVFVDAQRNFSGRVQKDSR